MVASWWRRCFYLSFFAFLRELRGFVCVGQEYALELTSLNGLAPVDAVIYAVAHSAFKPLTPKNLAALCRNGNGCGVVMDVKNVLQRSEVEALGCRNWSL